MTIQQIIDKQMKEFDKLLDGGRLTLEGNGITPVDVTQEIKSFMKSYERKLIEAVGEEVIGKNEPVRLQEVEVGPEGCTVYDVTEDISIFRNYLRDDQRLKLKEIINSLK